MNFVLGNYFIELGPGNYQDEEADDTLYAQPDLLQFSQADEIDCKIVDLAVDVDVDSCTIVIGDFWTLFFDGSKTLEGQGPAVSQLILRKIKIFFHVG